MYPNFRLFPHLALVDLIQHYQPSEAPVFDTDHELYAFNPVDVAVNGYDSQVVDPEDGVTKMVHVPGLHDLVIPIVTPRGQYVEIPFFEMFQCRITTSPVKFQELNAQHEHGLAIIPVRKAWVTADLAQQGMTFVEHYLSRFWRIYGRQCRRRTTAQGATAQAQLYVNGKLSTLLSEAGGLAQYRNQQPNLSAVPNWQGPSDEYALPFNEEPIDRAPTVAAVTATGAPTVSAGGPGGYSGPATPSAGPGGSARAVATSVSLPGAGGPSRQTSPGASTPVTTPTAGTEQRFFVSLGGKQYGTGKVAVSEILQLVNDGKDIKVHDPATNKWKLPTEHSVLASQLPQAQEEFPPMEEEIPEGLASAALAAATGDDPVAALEEEEEILAQDENQD